MASPLEIQKVFGAGLADSILSVLLSAALDNAFPPAKDLNSKPLWQVVLEAGGQTILNIVLLLEIRNHLPAIYAEDPTGAFVINGLLFQLQPNLLRKYFFLSQSLVQYAGTVFQPLSDPQVPQPSS